MQKLTAPIKYLTVLGCFSRQIPALESVGKGATFFVFIAALIGLLLALINYTLQPHLDARILALVAVSAWITMTGARHLHELKESFANKNGEPDRQTLGLIAVLLIVLFKIAALESMDELATLSLLIAPLLARWALLIFLYGYGSRFDETIRPLADEVHLLPILVSSVVTLGVVLYFLTRKGLWIALAVSVAALLLRELFFRRIAAVSKDHAGATVEISEALSLVLLAAL